MNDCTADLAEAPAVYYWRSTLDSIKKRVEDSDLYNKVTVLQQYLEGVLFELLAYIQVCSIKDPGLTRLYICSLQIPKHGQLGVSKAVSCSKSATAIPASGGMITCCTLKVAW